MLNEKVGKTGAIIVMDTDLTISLRIGLSI